MCIYTYGLRSNVIYRYNIWHDFNSVHDLRYLYRADNYNNNYVGENYNTSMMLYTDHKDLFPGNTLFHRYTSLRGGCGYRFCCASVHKLTFRLYTPPRRSDVTKSTIFLTSYTDIFLTQFSF